MALHTWLAFALVSLLVSVVPGPALLSVLAASLGGGVRRGAGAIAGILVADTIFFGCAAAGLGTLLTASPAVFGTVKWLGIAYLTYLGVRALVQRAESAARLPGIVRQPALWGLTTQLANPKIIVFIAALVPPFVDVHRPVALQFLVFGATFVCSDALVFALVALFAARARRSLLRPAAQTATRRATGVAMLGIAARMALDR